MIIIDNWVISNNSNFSFNDNNINESNDCNKSNNSNINNNNNNKNYKIVIFLLYVVFASYTSSLLLDNEVRHMAYVYKCTVINTLTEQLNSTFV